MLDWGQWQPNNVQLEDQFLQSQVNVVFPRLLCNPVDKNGEGIPHPQLHLVCYRILEQWDQVVRQVAVNNQFGRTQLWVGPGRLLCLPSMKQLAGD